MSALARYFRHRGLCVGGYDRQSTPLTRELEREGAAVHYTDDLSLCPAPCLERESTLVVYTPAIPESMGELKWFRTEGFRVVKRAEVLGLLTRSLQGLCVAGTHGKTTTSTMLAHLLRESHVDCSAFLGGISKNYNTNYLYSERSPYVVIEADEFDRSFHHLTPHISVVTATDPDHLDIYGTKEAYLESFRHYTSLIKEGGALLMHTGLALEPDLKEGVRLYTYGRGEGDFSAENIRIGGGEITFDLASPLEDIPSVRLGVPVGVNIDNGVAAMAVAQLSGVSAEEIRRGMATFQGVERRFDFKLKSDKVTLLSDYAHHPMEIQSCATSLREVFSGEKLTAIFQPHLYSRTRDFYLDFARALSLFDQVALTEIYPAREEPIPGVTSQLILDNIQPGVDKALIRKENATEWVKAHGEGVVVVLGAGDLDAQCPELRKVLSEKYHLEGQEMGAAH